MTVKAIDVCDKCGAEKQRAQQHTREFIDISIKLEGPGYGFVVSKNYLQLCPACLKKLGIEKKEGERFSDAEHKNIADRLYDIVAEIIAENMS